MPEARNFFSKEEKKDIVHAIREAERNTSGEIRVHLEEKCKDAAFDRAVQVFHKLKMDQTAQRNGVLIYLAVKDHKFAIIGDEAIDKVTEEGFWDDVKDVMQANFRNEEYTKGLTVGIAMVGEKLKRYFPYKTEDQNELPDDISFLK